MLAELDNDQRRRLIDARQVFEAWRETDREFRHSYKGSDIASRYLGLEFKAKDLTALPMQLVKNAKDLVGAIS